MKKEHFLTVYIVIAARTLLRAIGWFCSVAGDKPAPMMYISVSQTSREPVPTTWPFSSCKNVNPASRIEGKNHWPRVHCS